LVIDAISTPEISSFYRFFSVSSDIFFHIRISLCFSYLLSFGLKDKLVETRIFLDLFVIFAAAKIVGEIFERLHQPAVVGEILAGIVLGPHLLGAISNAPTLNVFADLGVVFLLFAVGLETRAADLLQLGRTAVSVAVLGVVLPFGLGLALMLALREQTTVALFVATAMVATSVGITARVFADLGQTSSRPTRVILAAAVLDDILGLILLAIVTGLAQKHLVPLHIGLIIAEALAFTVFTILMGRPAARRISAHLWRLRISNPAFVVSVVICFGLSALANRIGLAAIIGAFLAGMAFAETRDAPHIRRSMDPLYDLFVPMFFVIMGTHVDLYALATPQILLVGLVLTILAVIGKLVGCGLAARKLGRAEALIVGIGMVPRGEVGIVVAAIGMSRNVISADIYAIVLFMCLLTTLITPPLLRWRMGKKEKDEGGRMKDEPVAGKS
jgi:Kef-type K+ transport system membrane component KefB